jgi:hypothetical protein
MDPEKKMARRYHWLSENLLSFVDEPHTAVICNERRRVLNLVAHEAKNLRRGIVEIVKEERTEKLIAEVKIALSMPRHHEISLKDINLKKLENIVRRAKEEISSFEDLILVKGMGEKALKALALTSSLIYGTSISYRDPAVFSYAHGGKDGYPYRVNIRLLKNTIEILKEAINKAKIGNREKLDKIRKLVEWEKSLVK